EARVPAGSASTEVFMAARTSGGRSVEVRTTSWSTLSKNEGSIRAVYWTGFGIGDSNPESRIRNPDSNAVPHRTRSARRHAGPRRGVLRRADRPRRRELSHQRTARA